MEREQIVSIAYRDELIQRRLDSLPLAADVRDIVHQGIAWAWKDEEMHAIYTRNRCERSDPRVSPDAMRP